MIINKEAFMPIIKVNGNKPNLTESISKYIINIITSMTDISKVFSDGIDISIPKKEVSEDDLKSLDVFTDEEINKKRKFNITVSIE